MPCGLNTVRNQRRFTDPNISDCMPSAYDPKWHLDRSRSNYASSAVGGDGKRVCHTTSVRSQRVESTEPTAAAAEIACCSAVPVTIHSVVRTKHPPASSFTVEPCGLPLYRLRQLTETNSSPTFGDRLPASVDSAEAVTPSVRRFCAGKNICLRF